LKPESEHNGKTFLIASLVFLPSVLDNKYSLPIKGGGEGGKKQKKLSKKPQDLSDT
jgi:hypothetical protein